MGRKNWTSMEIILSQPEIPQNTGNIARTCAVTGTQLTLVRPLGFSLSSRRVKRAGLDYWEGLDVQIVDSLEDYLEASPEIPFYFFSTKAKRLYTEITFETNCRLVFGSETAGLPPSIHQRWPDHLYRIPMLQGARSLNLANSAAIVVYEAHRQNGFKGF